MRIKLTLPNVVQINSGLTQFIGTREHSVTCSSSESKNFSCVRLLGDVSSIIQYYFHLYKFKCFGIKRLTRCSVLQVCRRHGRVGVPAEQACSRAGRQLLLGQRRQQHLAQHEEGLSAHLQVSCFMFALYPNSFIRSNALKL